MERQSGRLRSSEAHDFSCVRVHYEHKISAVLLAEMKKGDLNSDAAKEVVRSLKLDELVKT